MSFSGLLGFLIVSPVKVVSFVMQETLPSPFTCLRLLPMFNNFSCHLVDFTCLIFHFNMFIFMFVIDSLQKLKAYLRQPFVYNGTRQFFLDYSSL